MASTTVCSPYANHQASHAPWMAKVSPTNAPHQQPQFSTASSPMQQHYQQVSHYHGAVTHNPYPVVSSSDSDNESSDNKSVPPPQYNDIPMLAPGTVHTPLMNSCEFVQIPYIAPRQLEPMLPEIHYSLFLGQIRFEIQPQELRWLIRRVAGVTAIKIDTRGPGCFLVHLRTETEVSTVRQVHKRLLFDRTGVWFARTADEVDVMQQYVTQTLPFVSRQYRLPRDSMVVEEQKSRNNSHHHRHSLTSNGMETSSNFSHGESQSYSGMNTPSLAPSSAPNSPYHRGNVGHMVPPSMYSPACNTATVSPPPGCTAAPGVPLPSYATLSSTASSCGDSPSLAPQSPQTPPPPYN